MRLVLSIAALAVIGLTSVAVAGEKAVPVQPASTSSSTVPVVEVGRTRTFFSPAARSQRGLFDGIMEVERRKNAWLRRTFIIF